MIGDVPALRREDIALGVLAVVADFAGETEIAEQARARGYTAEDAEALVARLAPEAERQSQTYDGIRANIVSRVLDDRFWLSDYQRMKDGTQAYAFIDTWATS